MPDVVNSNLYGNELRPMSQDVRLPTSAKIPDRIAGNTLVEDLRSASWERGTQPVANVPDITGPHCFGALPMAGIGNAVADENPAGLLKKRERHGRRRRLSLGELKTFPRAGLTGFLAFLHARIARQKSLFAQGATQTLIIAQERAADGQAERSGLSGNSTARGFCFHVKSVHCTGDFERAQDRVLHRETWKIVSKFLAVDFESSTPLAQADLGDGGLAAAGGDDVRHEKLIRRAWDSERR